jgi:hypothetical protein
MDFDRVSGTGPPRAARLTTAAHRALEFALHPDAGSRRVDLQQAIRALCEEARGQGVRAEELIVLFKKTWAERPELQGLSRDETGRLFDDMVSLCVEEFYRAPD